MLAVVLGEHIIASSKHWLRWSGVASAGSVRNLLAKRIDLVGRRFSDLTSLVLK